MTDASLRTRPPQAAAAGSTAGSSPLLWWNGKLWTWNGCEWVPAPCPPTPCPPTPPGPTDRPGVIDGSNAAPGMIGELINGSAVVNFPAYPTITDTTVTVMVVPPGDWDLYIASQFNTFIGGTAIYLDPIPSGMSSALEGALQMFQTAQQASNTELYAIIIGRFARASFTVPTLLPVRVKVDQSTDAVLTAGTCTVNIQGRRVR